MTPKYSIIIPVFHEETIINKAIEHLLTIRGGASTEVIVVDGDTGGTTLHMIRRPGIETLCSLKGRANQMNAGAARARGEIVLFLHADTRLPADAFACLDAALADPVCNAGAFDLAIDSDRPVFRIIAGIASLRSRITRIPYGDQALFFRRAFFNEIGGFSDLPLMEDVEIMRRLKKRHAQIRIIDHPVRTSSRRWEKEGIFRCTLRNWLLVSLYLAGVPAKRLARIYP